MNEIKRLLEMYEDMMCFEEERLEELVAVNKALKGTFFAFYLEETYKWHDQLRARIEALYSLIKLMAKKNG